VAILKPRPYQPIMVEHMLSRPRTGLWAGMGFGKTSSALTALDGMFVLGETRPALVVAPRRVAQSTWPDEAAKWDHLRDIEVRPIVGNAAERKKALTDTNANVFTVNYENIPWLIETLNGEWPFGHVVADESTKLKGFRTRQGTQRARALAKVAHAKCSGWTNLTGTPSPNGLIDLWGQTWFLDAGERLGRTYTQFLSRWFRPHPSGYGWVPLPTAQEQIQDKLHDICLALNPLDYFDIKEPIVNRVYVTLPPAARALYTEMEKRMYVELEGQGIEAFNAASRTMKCLQLASGALYLSEDANQWKEVHDVKIQALESIIEEAGGAPVLVAYHFRSDLTRLRRAFPKGRVLDNDPQTIRDWNAGRIPVLFAHPASAGHGLNLQDGGNILVFFSHNWNLEEYQQIVERIGPVRQLQAGYDRPVYIHHIVAQGTMDEIVMQRRETKREVQDLLLEALKHRRGL